jgi:hypothetical protein
MPRTIIASCRGTSTEIGKIVYPSTLYTDRCPYCDVEFCYTDMLLNVDVIINLASSGRITGRWRHFWQELYLDSIIVAIRGEKIDYFTDRLYR